MKVKNTGKEGYVKYEIENLDTDFSAIFVENKEPSKSFPVQSVQPESPQIRI